MNDKQLKVANIKNLTRLWQEMGAKPCVLEGMGKFRMSTGWPNRCWLEPQFFVDEMSITAGSIAKIPPNFVIPVWAEPSAFTGKLAGLLVDCGFGVLFEQTAMYLDLEQCQVTSEPGLEVRSIGLERDVRIWVDIVSRSFGYEVDKVVIQKMAVNPDIQLLMAYIGNHPVAAVLLFMTEDVMGVHQMGVVPEYRGQGIARKLMQDVVKRACQTPARYLTLQASSAGEHLYKTLGFNTQLKIRNYRRSQKVT